jgi:hypothetical protein
MKLNSQTVEIDGIDKKILRDLMEDARKKEIELTQILVINRMLLKFKK